MSRLRRTGPPERRKRLNPGRGFKSRGKPLDPGEGLGRSSKPLRQRSTKAVAVQEVRNELFRPYLNATCRIPSPVCTGRADAFHELVGRRQGGSKVDPRNLVPCANTCNLWIEDYPKVSRAKGWKVPRWEAIYGQDGLVPAKPSPFAIAGDWL